MKESCITRLQNGRFIILRGEFQRICDGSTPAALLLAIFEHWHNVKTDENEQRIKHNEIRIKQGEEPLEINTWVYKSHKDLIEDTRGLLRDYQVADGLKILLDKRFITKRTNPKMKWDKTLQYQLQPDIVNAEIKATYPDGEYFESVYMKTRTRTDNDSSADISRIETLPVTTRRRTDNEAIPYATSEDVAEREKEKKSSSLSSPLSGEREKQKDNNPELDLSIWFNNWFISLPTVKQKNGLLTWQEIQKLNPDNDTRKLISTYTQKYKDLYTNHAGKFPEMPDPANVIRDKRYTEEPRLFPEHLKNITKIDYYTVKESQRNLTKQERFSEKNLRYLYDMKELPLEDRQYIFLELRDRCVWDIQDYEKSLKRNLEVLEKNPYSEWALKEKQKNEYHLKYLKPAYEVVDSLTTELVKRVKDEWATL